MEAVDFPQAHPNDSINDLRRKVAIILESFCKHNPREPDTFLDIAQRLALECKESSGEGATREDFLRLLQNVQDTTHPVYLKVFKICERYPPTGVGGIRIFKTIGSAILFLLFHYCFILVFLDVAYLMG